MKRSIMLIAAAVMCSACNFSVPSGVVQTTMDIIGAAATTSENVETLMELPAHSESEDILTYDGYICSYNPSTKTPKWVAYELLSEELQGDANREGKLFSMAPNYHKTQAKREDYQGSGWTRGHMAPASDFRYSDDAMAETFYLVNICPQNEFLNANDWEYLERQVRKWARDFGRVWVVTGPIYDRHRYGTIGERNVAVPDAFFKAVLTGVDGKYRSIAFTMKNDDSRQYLYDCMLSVNDLEELTGIDFFPNLDDAYEDKVEAQLRYSDWGIRKR